MSKKIIVVLGMHRSGTSVVTRALRVMGVELGENLMQAQPNINAKGFWEDLDIVNFNEEILRVSGQSWDSFNLLHGAEVEQLSEQGYIDKAVDILNKKLQKCCVYGFKDPRTSKLMPFWVKVFEAGGFDVRFVIAIRNPVSVAESLRKRDGFSYQKSYLLWLQHTYLGLSNIHAGEVFVIEYDQLISSSGHVLNRLAGWLDLSVNEKELALFENDFLDQGLRHSSFTYTELDLDSTALDLVKKIFYYLREMTLKNSLISNHELTVKIAEWRKEFVQFSPLWFLLEAESANQLELQIKLAHITNQLIEKDNQLIEQSNLVEAYRSESLAYANTVEKMQLSLSWRLTLPLRKISSFLRRLK